MHKLKILLISLAITGPLLIGFFFISKLSQSTNPEPLFNKQQTQVLSENIGHLLADTLGEYAPYYDLQIVLNTVKRIENKEEPLKPPETCQIALLDLKCKILEIETHQNLRSAEQFLANLSASDKVKEVQKGKIYVEVIRQGEGSFISEESAPLLHFTEKNLNNKTIRDTREENKPIRIKLSETIAGFCRGVAGMQVGERRKIYVHPNLAYGKLSRQQLAIFDVEIIND